MNKSELRQILTGQDILCISSMAYGGMWTRKQRLMTILAESGNRILYVEPNFPMFAREGHSGAKKTKLSRVQDNLWVLSPRGILPLARFEFVRRYNFGHYVRTVQRAVEELGFTKPVLFTYLPVIHAQTPMIELTEHFKYSMLVYDCVDEHSETTGYDAKFVKKVDYDLTSRADVAFVTARGLYEDRKHLNKKLYLSPNGVDVEHFSKATLETTAIPEDVASIPEPRIGFVGALSDWIDFKLIARIATKYPEYSVVLVGPLKRGLRPAELERLANVHFLGKKPLEQLPGYLKAFACGINPFQRIGIAERVNPLKVYEYLGAGLPVISIDMPEVMQLEGVIAIARNDDEFVRLVGDAVTGRFKPDAGMLRTKLTEHDWNEIFGILLRRVAENLP